MLDRVVMTGLVACAMLVSSACAGPVLRDDRVITSEPDSGPNPATDLAQRTFTTPFRQDRLPALERYNTERNFKAVASNGRSVRGAAAGELSLFAAEREARLDCTRRSSWQGDCETTQVGEFNVSGLSESLQDKVRWQYMQQVHQGMAQRSPLNKRLPAKVLAPGSRVANADLWLSGTFRDGGLVALRMPSYSCAGTMDPVRPEDIDEVESSPDQRSIGFIEFACSNGAILRGGYAYQNAQNQLFFVEDMENERWDFLLSTKAQSVGSSVISFKKLFREIEELD